MAHPEPTPHRHPFPGPTHGQAIGSEECDTGQERKKAQIDDQCSTTSLIAIHPGDHAADETAGNEQVVEADVERPQADRSDIGRWDGKDALMHTRPLKQKGLHGKSTDVYQSSKQREDPNDHGHETGSTPAVPKSGTVTSWRLRTC